METNTSAQNTVIKAIVLDIEGTTCPVSFVSQTLFPYAQKQLAKTISRPDRESTITNIIQEVITEWKKDTDNTSKELLLQTNNQTTPSDKDVIRYLDYLIQCDRKSTALKELQGIIWEQGYTNGELQSPLFADVIPALDNWKKQGLSIAVYSSGSVKAQQLLYSNTQRGNISDRFSQWFDTRTGPKLEANSYTKISELLKLKPQSIVFVSDHPGECDAAQMSGMQTRFCLREGNPYRRSGRHPVIESLSEIEVVNEATVKPSSPKTAL